MQPLLVVGLGNPGASYDGTRHNIGFAVVTKLAELMDWKFYRNNQFHGLVAKGVVEGKVIYLLLPETYMNLSGQAVLALSRYFKILAPQIMVVTDDIDIPFASLRIRLKGSPGTHNGLKSITEMLGTREFPRFKIGVGDRNEGNLSDHVLGKFTAEEQKTLPKLIDRAAEALRDLLVTDIHKVMTAVNTIGTKSNGKQTESL